jgi:hypothetical protein
LNQIGYLFALIEAFALNRQIRNARASQSAFVGPDTGEGPQQNGDVFEVEARYAGLRPALLTSQTKVWATDQRANSPRYLFGVAFLRC